MYLEVSVNEIINLKVLIVISPGIEEGFSNFDPTQVCDEFNDCEYRNVDDWCVHVKGLSLLMLTPIELNKFNFMSSCGSKYWCPKRFEHKYVYTVIVITWE